MNMSLEGGGEKTVSTKMLVSDLAVFSQSHPTLTNTAHHSGSLWHVSRMEACPRHICLVKMVSRKLDGSCGLSEGRDLGAQKRETGGVCWSH